MKEATGRSWGSLLEVKGFMKGVWRGVEGIEGGLKGLGGLLERVHGHRGAEGHLEGAEA